MIRVPFLDMAAQIAPLRAAMLEATGRVLDSGCFCLGPEVEAFEQEFAALHDCRYGVGVNSGTSALHLALQACDVQAGDEVITTALTFVATSAAIRYAGARPVYADVDPDSATLDWRAVERRIGPRTKAILAVHLYGQPCALEPLAALAEKHGLTLLEDAAQAHLSRYRGRPVGSFGRAAAFSFYPGKNLGACGEGGIVVTSDSQLAERMRRLRDWGQTRKYQHDEFGYNYRMDALQGALLRVKLPHLPTWTAARRRLARRYDELLATLPLQVWRESEGCESAFHLYTVGVPDRDEVRAQMRRRGIDCGVHYPVPVHLQPAYRDPDFPAGSLPVTEAICANTLSLPLYPELSEAQQEAVVAALRELLR